MSSYNFKRNYAKEMSQFSNKTFPIKTLLVGINVSKSTVNGCYITPVIWNKEKVNNPRLYKKMVKRASPVIKQLAEALVTTAAVAAMWLNKDDSFFNPPYSTMTEYIWDRKNKVFKLVIEMELYSGHKRLFIFNEEVMASEIVADLTTDFCTNTPRVVA